MKAVDFIIKHIEEHNLNQTQAAEIAGMSRQNFWDKLNNRNPRFNTMTVIIDRFGYKLHIVRKDGKPIEFPDNDFFEAASKGNLVYDAVESIVSSMGYELKISEKAE